MICTVSLYPTYPVYPSSEPPASRVHPPYSYAPAVNGSLR